MNYTREPDFTYVEIMQPGTRFLYYSKLCPSDFFTFYFLNNFFLSFFYLFSEKYFLYNKFFFSLIYIYIIFDKGFIIFMDIFSINIIVTLGITWKVQNCVIWIKNISQIQGNILFWCFATLTIFCFASCMNTGIENYLYCCWIPMLSLLFMLYNIYIILL